MPKSCYILELSVTPGGARRGDLFTYNRPAHVRRCLEHEFHSPDPQNLAYTAALAAGHRETIVVWVVEAGKLVRAIDLHPYIRIRLDDDPAIPIADARERDEGWKDRLAGGGRIAFEIDWDSISAETPALHGEPLRPGEQLDLEVDEDVIAPFDSYLEIAETVRYGYEDLEGGEPGLPGFVDPDPAPTSPTKMK